MEVRVVRLSVKPLYYRPLRKQNNCSVPNYYFVHKIHLVIYRLAMLTRTDIYTSY